LFDQICEFEKEEIHLKQAEQCERLNKEVILKYNLPFEKAVVEWLSRYACNIFYSELSKAMTYMDDGNFIFFPENPQKKEL
jgi:hypothetical protein